MVRPLGGNNFGIIPPNIDKDYNIIIIALFNLFLSDTIFLVIKQLGTREC